MFIHQLFISPGHNYFGHHGRAPDEHPIEEVNQIECAAGHGIRGDRFFDYKDNYKGQITFFAREDFDWLAAQYPAVQKSPGVLRRNVIVSGVNLLSLIGQDFELQGVCFRGTAHCKPCYWLDQAFAPGTEEMLARRGGLRAQILSDGCLTTGPAELILAQGELAV